MFPFVVQMHQCNRYKNYGRKMVLVCQVQIGQEKEDEWRRKKKRSFNVKSLLRFVCAQWCIPNRIDVKLNKLLLH